MESLRYGIYLFLEKELAKLDRNDPLAEALEDSMDRIWFLMTDEEHERLNARKTEGVEDGENKNRLV